MAIEVVIDAKTRSQVIFCDLHSNTLIALLMHLFSFEWRINKEDQDYLTVEPSSGVILPNEIQAHEISLKTEKKKVSHYKTFLRVTSDMTK